MKIITAYPVIDGNKIINRKNNTSVVDSDWESFCNGDGEGGYYGPFLPGQSPQEKAAEAAKPKEVTGTKKPKKGNIVDKGKSLYDKGKSSGVLDSLNTLGKEALNKKAGKGKGTKAPVTSGTSDTGSSNEPVAKPPMSTTTKVLIGVGAVAALIGLYVLATKKGK